MDSPCLDWNLIINYRLLITSRNIKLLTTTKLEVKNTPKLDKFRMMAEAIAICVRILAWIRRVLIGM
jgi:hypothetical protein